MLAVSLVRPAQDFEYNSTAGITKDVTYDDMGRPIVLNHFQDDGGGIQEAGEETIVLFTY